MANIKIYSTPTCAFCKKAKEYLDSQNISYTSIDVAADQDKAREMIEKSGQMGTPVIDIDGEIIVGFNKEKIDGILGLK